MARKTKTKTKTVIGAATISEQRGLTGLFKARRVTVQQPEAKPAKAEPKVQKKGKAKPKQGTAYVPPKVKGKVKKGKVKVRSSCTSEALAGLHESIGTGRITFVTTFSDGTEFSGGTEFLSDSDK